MFEKPNAQISNDSTEENPAQQHANTTADADIVEAKISNRRFSILDAFAWSRFIGRTSQFQIC